MSRTAAERDIDAVPMPDAQPIGGVRVDPVGAVYAHPACYGVTMIPNLQIARHVAIIMQHLVAVERGEIKRLIIEAPPRHTKTLSVSTVFPAWYLARHPEREVILATYSQERANDLGRALRDVLQNPMHTALFPLAKIRRDQQGVKSIGIVGGGKAHAVGIGGPTTGRGAHVFVVDDPFKDRMQADSVKRRKTVIEWFSSVASTRVYKGGAIIVMACMTGETPVLMSDGTEKSLAEIRPGDQVATYDNGALSSSEVLNWKSCGEDQILEIRTASGRTVRANDRHPFLALEDGELKWIRVKDLHLGHALAKVSGESGGVKAASLKDAVSLFPAVDTASPTTTKSGGQTESGHLQRTKRRSAQQGSNTDMESRLTSTAGWSKSKAARAQSARTPPLRTTAPVGAESCASITATKQAESEVFCATTVICSSDMPSRPGSLWQQRITSDFIADPIVSIKSAGVAEVFDVQIARTENFIANGLVSHNTRWHEDDLSGWLLANQSDQGWVRLRLPAIAEDADDALGRDVGDALWPENFDLGTLASMRGIMLPRDWSALYQQRPVAAEGGRFKRAWFERRHTAESLPSGLRHYAFVDWAVTPDDGDYTQIGIWGIGSDGMAYAVDWTGGQFDPDDGIDAFLSICAKHKVKVAFMASGVIRRAIGPALRRAMKERQQFIAVEYLHEGRDKEARSLSFAARASGGMVSFPKGPRWTQEVIDELAVFPGGKHDDCVDVCSLVGMAIDKMIEAAIKSAPKAGAAAYTFDWLASGAGKPEQSEGRTF